MTRCGVLGLILLAMAGLAAWIGLSGSFVHAQTLLGNCAGGTVTVDMVSANVFCTAVCGDGQLDFSDATGCNLTQYMVIM